MPDEQAQRTYGLGVLAAPDADRLKEPDPPVGTIDIRIDISRADWERFVAAAGPLTSLERREVFALLTTNYSELIDVHSFIRNLEGHERDRSRFDHRAATERLNALLINWLTSMRLYLDHSETRLNRTFGADSVQFKAFKTTCSEAFDTAFGYRFAYRLRNYTLHCGLPISSIDLVARRPGSPPHWRQEVIFSLSRDRLLEEFDDWGPVRKDLEEGDTKIEIIPFVESAMGWLARIEEAVFRIDLNHALAQWPVVEEALDRLGDVEGAPTLFEFTIENDTVRNISMVKLPSDRSAVADLMSAEDPIALLRERAMKERKLPVIAASRARTDRTGALAIGKWVDEGGSTQAFIDYVNDIIERDQDVQPLVIGVVNCCVVLLHMASIALGRSSESIIGGILEDLPDVDV